MPTPQSGIFVEGSAHHYFLEYAVASDVEVSTVRAALRRALEPVAEAPDTQCVVAFGPGLWTRLAAGAMPEDFHPFERIDGWNGRTAPATQADVLVWLHGPAHDRNFHRALAVNRALAGLGRPRIDLAGFTYLDSRDLTGFIDGTANPGGDEAREVALVPDGAVGAGGSFVITQRWVHDLTAFHALSVKEQQNVIGRTKPDSVEMEDDAKPADAHIARTEVTVDGVEQEIYRRSAPYGTVGEHGLYFIAFACELARFTVLLKRMFGLANDGVHDRLIEFSTPVTGSFWFAPAQEDLKAALASG